jgi:hypothetical protein
MDELHAIITAMVEGAELPAVPQGDLRKYVDETLLPGN